MAGSYAWHFPSGGLPLPASLEKMLHLGEAHLAAKHAELILERDLLRTHVLAAEKPEAAEDSILVSHYLEILIVLSFVARVHHETGNPVEGGRSHEAIGQHVCLPASRDTAAAFDTAFEFVNLIGERIIHPLFFSIRNECLISVDPRLHLFVHSSEPGPRIDREVTDQLKYRHGHQSDLTGQLLGLGVARQVWLSIYHNCAGAADTRPAHEIEHEGWVLFLPDTVKSNEKSHGLGFLEIIRIHVRNRSRVLRAVSEDVEL